MFNQWRQTIFIKAPTSKIVVAPSQHIHHSLTLTLSTQPNPWGCFSKTFPLRLGLQETLLYNIYIAKYNESVKLSISAHGFLRPSSVKLLAVYSACTHLSDNDGLAERIFFWLLRFFFWEETHQKNAIDVENRFWAEIPMVFHFSEAREIFYTLASHG